MINESKEDQPFLYGCDSETIAERSYNCKTEVPESEYDKFILLTAATNIKIYDAEEQFKNKFVFFSPCITYGMDFSIDTAQNVYMSQKGNSILPFGTWQQSTRCGNIKTLFIYSDVKPQKFEYKSLEQIQQNMRDNITYYNESIYNVSTVHDEEEEKYKIIENNFFDLYCYTEYIKNIYGMNMTAHYIDHLKDNGFILTEEEEANIINPERNVEIKELTAEQKERLFQELIIDEDKKNEKYDNIHKPFEFLEINGGRSN